MPSKSPKQARLMAACAHGAGYDSCPPVKVATEFNQADKGSKLLSRAMKKRADGGQTTQEYIIKKNDVLSRLANKFGTTVDNLMAVNPQIKNANKIREGATLYIPPFGDQNTKAAPPPPPPAPPAPTPPPKPKPQALGVMFRDEYEKNPMSGVIVVDRPPPPPPPPMIKHEEPPQHPNSDQFPPAVEGHITPWWKQAMEDTDPVKMASLLNRPGGTSEPDLSDYVNAALLSLGPEGGLGGALEGALGRIPPRIAQPMAGAAREGAVNDVGKSLTPRSLISPRFAKVDPGAMGPTPFRTRVMGKQPGVPIPKDVRVPVGKDPVTGMFVSGSPVSPPLPYQPEVPMGGPVSPYDLLGGSVRFEPRFGLSRAPGGEVEDNPEDLGPFVNTIGQGEQIARPIIPPAVPNTGANLVPAVSRPTPVSRTFKPYLQPPHNEDNIGVSGRGTIGELREKYATPGGHEVDTQYHLYQGPEDKWLNADVGFMTQRPKSGIPKVSDEEALAGAQAFSQHLGEDWNLVRPADQQRYIEAARQTIQEARGYREGTVPFGSAIGTDGLKVLSAVSSSVHNFIDSIKPSAVTFSAAHPDLSKTYQRFANMVAKKYNGTVDSDGHEFTIKFPQWNKPPGKASGGGIGRIHDISNMVAPLAMLASGGDVEDDESQATDKNTTNVPKTNTTNAAKTVLKPPSYDKIQEELNRLNSEPGVMRRGYKLSTGGTGGSRSAGSGWNRYDNPAPQFQDAQHPGPQYDAVKAWVDANPNASPQDALHQFGNPYNVVGAGVQGWGGLGGGMGISPASPYANSMGYNPETQMALNMLQAAQQKAAADNAAKSAAANASPTASTTGSTVPVTAQSTVNPWVQNVINAGLGIQAMGGNGKQSAIPGITTGISDSQMPQIDLSSIPQVGQKGVAMAMPPDKFLRGNAESLTFAEGGAAYVPHYMQRRPNWGTPSVPQRITTGLPPIPPTKTYSPHMPSVRASASAGLLHSSVPGRTDKIGVNIRSGSYVIPADVVAGHGQGNTLAGAAALDKLFKSGPYGISAPNTIKTYGNKAPSAPKIKPLKPTFITPHKSKGGAANHVPVMAAGGEYVISPESVAAIGGGDPQKGFKILDAFVLQSRKKQVKTIKKLKPPKKD